MVEVALSENIRETKELRKLSLAALRKQCNSMAHDRASGRYLVTTGPVCPLSVWRSAILIAFIIICSPAIGLEFGSVASDKSLSYIEWPLLICLWCLSKVPGRKLIPIVPGMCIEVLP